MNGDPTCKSCGAPIRWAQTVNGKAIPLDRHPVTGGNIVLSRKTGKELAYVMPDGDETAELRYVSHFATCPNAEEHRRRDG